MVEEKMFRFAENIFRAPQGKNIYNHIFGPRHDRNPILATTRGVA
jgi:hypothetical protein